MLIYNASSTQPFTRVPCLLAALVMALAGCASQCPRTSGSSAQPDRDGPEAVVPANLMQVPNAAPQMEAIRKGGPNKPYEVLGQRYEPMTEDKPLIETGLASWYGKKFHGRPTASGEIYNMYSMTGAHATMPIPSFARVRNPVNGQQVIVRINDRGPFHKGRVIDLSYTAALKLDILRGVTAVEVERITYDEIRSGAWQSDRDAAVFASAGATDAPSLSSTAAVAAAANLRKSPPADGLPSAAAAGFWVQLGAFSKLDGAEAMRRKLVGELEWMAPLLAVFKHSGLHRLQAGPYASRDDASQAAQRVRNILTLAAVVVVVVERQ